MVENKVGRITTAYDYLKSIGKAHKQQDVADKMGTDKANVSRAMKGDEKYLTDRFLHRFNSAFDNLFNEEWLISGNGEMLAKPNQTIGDISNSNVSGVNVSGSDIHINPNAYDALLKIVENNQKSTERFQNEIDRLITIIELKFGING